MPSPDATSRPGSALSSLRTSRLAVAIWAAFAALLVAGFVGSAAVNAASAASASSAGYAQSTPNIIPAGEATEPACEISACAGKFDRSVFKDYNPDNASELLPAFRWKGADWLYSDFGVKDQLKGKSVMSTFASVFFSIASLMWGLLLWAFQKTLSLDLLATASQAIDAGFVGMANAIAGSGLIMFLIVATLLGFGVAAIRGKATGAVATLLAFIVPLGLISAMATASSGATQATNGQAYVSPVGTPSWVARKGVELVDSIGTGLGSGFGMTAAVGGGATDSPALKDPGNCAQYAAALEQVYRDAMLGSGAAELTPEDEKRIARGDKTVIERIKERDAEVARKLGRTSALGVVDKVWQRAYLAGWSRAQYGSSDLGQHRVSCQQLEEAANVDKKERQQLLRAAFGDAPHDTAHAMRTSLKDDDYEAMLFGYAACTRIDDNWKVREGWKEAIHKGDAKSGAEECRDWFKADNNEIPDLRFEDDEIDDGFPKRNDKSDPTNQEDEAASMVRAFWADNGPQRFTEGVFAMITAGIYLWALGGLAVGALIAQLGLVLALMLLPVTLMLMTLRSTRPKGMKLMKLTGGFLAARLVTMTVLVLLLQIIFVFEAIIQTQTAVDGIASMLIPLLAVFLLSKLLQMAGLGNLMTPLGAATLTASAAAAVTGDQDLRRRASDLSQRAGTKSCPECSGTGKKETEGEDGKKHVVGCPRCGGTGTANRAFVNSNPYQARRRRVERLRQEGRDTWFDNLKKAGGEKFGETALGMKMDNNKGAWFGKKDEDGKFIGGKLNQMTSLAGMAALAKGRKEDGKLSKLLNSGFLSRWANVNETNAKRAKLAASAADARKKNKVRLRTTAEERAAGKGRFRSAADITELRDQEMARQLQEVQRMEMVARAQDLKAEAAQNKSLQEVLQSEVDDGKNGQQLLDEIVKILEEHGKNGLQQLDGTQLAFILDSKWDEYEKHTGAMALGLDPKQMVAGPGTRGRPVPAERNPDGTFKNPLFGEDAHPAAVEALLTDPVTWADPQVTRRRLGESDAQYADRLSLLSSVMPPVDLKSYGIDLQTEAGRMELAKMQAGQPSKFDRIQTPYPAKEVARITRLTQTMHGRGGTQQQRILQGEVNDHKAAADAVVAAKQEAERFEQEVVYDHRQVLMTLNQNSSGNENTPAGKDLYKKRVQQVASMPVNKVLLEFEEAGLANAEANRLLKLRQGEKSPQQIQLEYEQECTIVHKKAGSVGKDMAKLQVAMQEQASLKPEEVDPRVVRTTAAQMDQALKKLADMQADAASELMKQRYDAERQLHAKLQDYVGQNARYAKADTTPNTLIEVLETFARPAGEAELDLDLEYEELSASLGKGRVSGAPKYGKRRHETRIERLEKVREGGDVSDSKVRVATRQRWEELKFRETERVRDAQEADEVKAARERRRPKRAESS